MIKLEKTEVVGWEAAIRGMRNPMNSWDKGDSCIKSSVLKEEEVCPGVTAFVSHQCEPFISVGPNDHELMMKLAKGGSVHAKYRRMIHVYVDITAPLYWWKEFDTYKVGTTANSCSTMHKIHAKEFTLDDFSHEHLIDSVSEEPEKPFEPEVPHGVTVWSDDDTGCLAVTCRGEFHKDHLFEATLPISQKDVLDMFIIPALNSNRNAYLKTKDKKYWWQMIQLLPSSYNQKRTVDLNYEVLVGMYRDRKNHKLDEWRELTKWIEGLPYSELITGEANG